MMRLPMSRAGAALLRAIFNHAQVERDRILLIAMTSTDWQSLTFIGERHVLDLRIPGPDAESVCAALTRDLADAELCVPGQTVADIGLMGPPATDPDGSITPRIEALTIGE